MCRIFIRLINKFRPRKGYLKRIENYEEKFSHHGERVSLEETASVHVAKLVLFRNPEFRLASLQTLAEQGCQECFAPALKDAISSAKKWPHEPIEHHACHVFNVLSTYNKAHDKEL
ncbi:MAG TPA: hypothetical protein PKW95_18115 [bacterium]|nr:hypothetical protein [bacterium]